MPDLVLTDAEPGAVIRVVSIDELAPEKLPATPRRIALDALAAGHRVTTRRVRLVVARRKQVGVRPVDDGTNEVKRVMGVVEHEVVEHDVGVATGGRRIFYGAWEGGSFRWALGFRSDGSLRFIPAGRKLAARPGASRFGAVDLAAIWATQGADEFEENAEPPSTREAAVTVAETLGGRLAWTATRDEADMVLVECPQVRDGTVALHCAEMHPGVAPADHAAAHAAGADHIHVDRPLGEA